MLVLATSNPHKIEELTAILRPVVSAEIVSLPEACARLGRPVPSEPAETGESFADNARLKASTYAHALGAWCLADDSGLEVDALDGEPGVHSAHWAGRDGSRQERDARNNAKLLAAMRDVPDAERGARFVCVICLADPAGQVRGQTRGTFEGRLVSAPRGAGGFGYDPLLLVPDAGCTSAELTAEEKNRRSHRGAAARAMAAWIDAHLAGEVR